MISLKPSCRMIGFKYKPSCITTGFNCHWIFCYSDSFVWFTCNWLSAGKWDWSRGGVFTVSCVLRLYWLPFLCHLYIHPFFMLLSANHANLIVKHHLTPLGGSSEIRSTLEGLVYSFFFLIVSNHPVAWPFLGDKCLLFLDGTSRTGLRNSCIQVQLDGLLS